MTGPLRIGGLFEGYGGLTMAVQSVLGGDLAWYAETDPQALAVLGHHDPHTPNLGDVRVVDWSTTAPVDVLTGGFPCQDVSHAGLRTGLGPETRSGLWAHMASAVDHLRPAIVAIENVRGLHGAPSDSDVEPCAWCVGDGRDEPALRALGAVLGDLADLRYDAAWHCLPASAVGAPHSRHRTFILATPTATPGVATGGHRDRPGRRNAATDTTRVGRAGTGQARNRGDGPAHGHRRPTVDPWGQYGPAIRRWERQLGRDAPPATVAGVKSSRVLSARFVEWMMGLPEGHVTSVDGLTRQQQIRLLGAGVVPQQAAAALRTLLRVHPGLSRPQWPTSTTPEGHHAARR